MKKKTRLLFVTIVLTVVCFVFGLVSCNKNTGNGAHIVIRTNATELVVEIGENYTTPIAGVFDENMDRVSGNTIMTSVYNPKGTLLEESEEQISFRFVSKGTWRIVYTAYENGAVDEQIPQATITVYVCNVLQTPQNLVVKNNTLTWDKVQNAQGYEVSVNGGTPILVQTESFTSDIFATSGYYVAVTAKGDNINSLDSRAGAYRNRTPLRDGELMAFNDPNYELDIKEAVESSITLPPDEIKWLSEEECEGSTGGALRLRIRSGDYGWGIFKVLLMDGVTIDTNEDWEGIEIRLKIDSQNYMDSTKFLLCNPNGYTNAESRGIKVTLDNNNQWYIIKLSKSLAISEGYKKYTLTDSSSAALEGTTLTWDRNEKAYGYRIKLTRTAPDGTVTEKSYTNFSSDNGFTVKESDTSYSYDIKTADIYVAEEGYTYTAKVSCEIPTAWTNLNFNLYNLVRTTGKGYVYLDYVRLCKEDIDTPQNFKYENGKILWDAVDGAAFYTLNVVTLDEMGKDDSTFYIVDGTKTEFDLSTIGVDPATDKFRAEIRATPADATKGTSEWAVFDQVGQPTGLSIDSNNLLSWTAVDNARGYVVSVNGEEFETSETKYDLTRFVAKGDVITYVKAIGSAGYRDGEFSLPCGKVQLTGNQVATFNSRVYKEMVAKLPNGVQGGVGETRITSVNYMDENSCQGSQGGALDVVMKFNGGTWRFDVVVTFANPIDCSNADGLAVRVKVYDTSAWNMSKENSLFLKLVKTDGSNYTDKTNTDYVKAIKAQGEWVTVLFKSEFVKTCLVDNGMKLTLQFGIKGPFSWMETPNIDGTFAFYIDDISYYKQLPTPTNLTYNAGTLSWNAVANATSYVVKIGETEIPTVATSLNIASYLEGDTIVQVQAIGEGFENSEYAVKNVLVLKSHELASFNHEAYLSTVGVVEGAVHKTFRTDPTYKDGTVAFTIRDDDYRAENADWTNMGAFTVTLPIAMNLESGNDGIKIRAYVGPGSRVGAVSFEMLNSTRSDAWHSRSSVSVSIGDASAKAEGWVELKVTNAQLASLGYKTGDTVLTFALRCGGNHTVKNDPQYQAIALDYIEYYKEN